MRKIVTFALGCMAVLFGCTSAADPSGGAGGGGAPAGPKEWTTAASSSSSSASGPASGSGGGCLLDEGSRFALRRVLDQSLADLAWIAGQSGGAHLPPRNRAFGVSIPLTKAALLDVATVDDAPCDVPKTFETSCEAVKDPGGTDYARCNQLVCRGPGTLAVNAWLEPVPVLLSAGTTLEKVQLAELAHTTTYQTSGDALFVFWFSRYALGLAGGRSLRVTLSGAAKIAAARVQSANLVVFVDGLLRGRIELDALLRDDGMAGQATADDGGLLLTFEPGHIEWDGACSYVH